MNKSTYWYGSSPKSWESTKVKFLFKVKNGGTPKSEVREYWDEEGLTWFTPEDVSKEGKNISDSKRKISILGMENSSANFIEPYSLVLSTRAPIGNLKLSTVKFTTNQGCKSLESTSNLDMDYYYYFFSIAKEYLNSLGQGTTFLELSNNYLKNVEVPLPDLNLQKAIANCLNKQTQNIDALIQVKLALIELLEEKRQSMITEAVTKGLNLNVKMKDSGLKYIDKIPEHWEVKRIKHIAKKRNYSLVDGPFGSDLKNEEYTDEGVPIIQLNNIKNGEHLFNTIKYVTEEKAQQLNKHTAIPGDLVIAKMAHPVGRSAIVKAEFEKYVIVADCIKLSLDENYYNKFINYAMNTIYFISQAELVAGGITRLRINLGDLRQLKLFIPPYEEQIVICEYLDSKVEELTDLITLVTKQIEKLEEYRQSLIYEAVTGKIDVRDFEVEA